ncbi:hypothetical protein NEIRO02_2215 [Nematocida sp. AWRm79]|nr:hypothetical protein NEIRO02_2215 [Nematocida sp. AWRm79]
MAGLIVAVIGGSLVGKSILLNNLCINYKKDMTKVKEGFILYKKETLSDIFEFVELTLHPENFTFMCDSSLFDILCVVIDIRTGLSDYIRNILKKYKKSLIIIVINKIDKIFGMQIESILTITYNIINAVNKYLALCGDTRGIFCVVSSLYKICLFSGYEEEWMGNKDTFRIYMKKLQETADIVDMPRKDKINAIHQNNYYGFLSKEKMNILDNLSIISDICIHANGVPSIQNVFISAMTNILGKLEIQHYGYHAVLKIHKSNGRDRIYVIIRISEKETNHFMYRNHLYTAISIKIDSLYEMGKLELAEIVIDPQTYDQIIQLHIENSTCNKPMIGSTITNITEAAMKKIITNEIMFCPGVNISWEKINSCAENSYICRIFSNGPDTLERILEELAYIGNINNIKDIMPNPITYYIRRTPSSKTHIKFYIENRYVLLEVCSNLKNNVSEIEKTKTPPVELDTLSIEKYTRITIDNKEEIFLDVPDAILLEERKIIDKLANTLKELWMEMDLHKKLAYTTLRIVEIMQNNLNCDIPPGSGKDLVRVRLERCRFWVIEHHLRVEFVLSLPMLTVYKSTDKFINSLILKPGILPVIKSIVKKCFGKLISFELCSTFMQCRAECLIPISEYTECISMLRTFFSECWPYLLEHCVLPIKSKGECATVDINMLYKEKLPIL